MSKVIRSTGTNVTASDDAYILSKLFDDGLFAIPNITASGNKLHITSFRGIVAGRDFQVDEQDIIATMGTGRNQGAFKVFIDINLGNSDKIKLITSQTIPSGANNTDVLSGTHFYLELGSYKATNVSITDISVTSKQSRIKIAETLDQLIKKVNEMKWKYLGTLKQSNTRINISSEYSEVLAVYTSKGTSYDVKDSLVIPLSNAGYYDFFVDRTDKNAAHTFRFYNGTTYVLQNSLLKADDTIDIYVK